MSIVPKVVESFEDGLNPEQLAVVRHGAGPCAVLAQAGSGKTASLVRRIARLVSEGVAPESILAVTFSKKAADEMNDRLEKLGVSRARVGTWHSLCLEILRVDATEWSRWRIDERDEHKRAVKDALGFRGLNAPNMDLGKVRSFIGFCKAQLWAPSSPEATAYAKKYFAGVPPDAKGRSVASLATSAFALSQEAIERKGLLTFDDFLVFVHRHLSDDGTRRRWAGRWGYLLQDEAQDSNPAQNAIAEMLAREHRNYMVVGDVAQAIYGFRGSSPRYLSEFAELWSARTVVMNRNYRSGAKIVSVANDIIRPATVRIDSDMVPERAPFRGAVSVVAAADFDDEAGECIAWVAKFYRAKVALRDVTVLFRLNSQSRALEEQLLKRRIPYVIVGGVSFYDRKEVKDLLAYLRLALGRDPEGDALRRCINAPFRFLGARFVDRMMEGYTPGGDLYGRVSEVCAEEGIQARQRAAAREWCELVGSVGTMAKDPTLSAGALLDAIVRRTGYLEWVEKEEGEESLEQSAGGNVRELIRVGERFPTAGELLDYIEQNQAAAKKQRAAKDAGDRVTLMSIHRSKGLEWPYVWVVGVNDGILPHSKGDPEEERRLMYVATTRAREGLVLSWVRSMSNRMGVRPAAASSFLADAGLVRREPPAAPPAAGVLPLGAERTSSPAAAVSVPLPESLLGEKVLRPPVKAAAG